MWSECAAGGFMACVCVCVCLYCVVVSSGN